ncbi:hypothetical protein FRB99_000299 [Tulasnella sp. 403]|nr:hypothetical protein FRB99_000299 [Tulasnella sp. 403]
MAALERELEKALIPLLRLGLKKTRLAFALDSEIGFGGFGTVHRATMDGSLFTSGTVVAVKKLRIEGDRKQCVHIAIAFVRELAVWAALKHPNILPLIGYHMSPELDEAWLVSSFASNGNVTSYIQHTELDLQERLELAKDTALGLEYLHTRTPPVCHGDIKALNVLIGNDGRAMLCDFGLAKRTKGMPTALLTTCFNQGGTVRYLSPELFGDKAIRTLESDVWAWGCLLLEVSTFRRNGPPNVVNLAARLLSTVRHTSVLLSLLPSSRQFSMVNFPPDLTIQNVLNMFVGCFICAGKGNRAGVLRCPIVFLYSPSIRDMSSVNPSSGWRLGIRRQLSILMNVIS